MKSQISEQFAFSRTEVAKIVGIDPAVVKNWSTGKPLTIPPTVRALGIRGSTTFYSRYDVYKMAIAVWLQESGFNLSKVDALVRVVSPAWFQEGTRGRVVFLFLEDVQPMAQHLPHGKDDWDVTKVFLSNKQGLQRGAHVLNLKAVLDWVDDRIAKNRRTR